jgi:hypothetical protein
VLGFRPSPEPQRAAPPLFPPRAFFFSPSIQRSLDPSIARLCTGFFYRLLSNCAAMEVCGHAARLKSIEPLPPASSTFFTIAYFFSPFFALIHFVFLLSFVT